jgi:hypothetical protein
MMTGGKIHQANNANNALQVRKPAQHLSRKDPDVAEDLSACVLLIAAAGIGFNRDLHDSCFITTGKRSKEHAAGACFSSGVNRRRKKSFPNALDPSAPWIGADETVHHVL